MLLHYPAFTKLNLCALRFYLTVFVFITMYLRQCQLWLVNYSHTHCLQTLFLIFNCVSIETKECFVMNINRWRQREYRYCCTNFSLHKVLNSNLANICPRKVPSGDRKGIARAPEAPPSLPPSVHHIYFFCLADWWRMASEEKDTLTLLAMNLDIQNGWTFQEKEITVAITTPGDNGNSWTITCCDTGF